MYRTYILNVSVIQVHFLFSGDSPGCVLPFSPTSPQLLSQDEGNWYTLNLPH